MDDTKNFWQRLFKRNRNDSPQSEAEKEHSLREQLESLACNGIFFDFDKTSQVSPWQSKFGGRPALPPKWKWPHYTDEYGNRHGDYHPGGSHPAGNSELFLLLNCHKPQQDVRHSEVAKSPCEH